MPHESAVLDPTAAGFGESNVESAHKFVSAPSTGRDFFCRESNSFSVPLPDCKGRVEDEDEDDSTSENNSDTEHRPHDDLTAAGTIDNNIADGASSNDYY